MQSTRVYKPALNRFLQRPIYTTPSYFAAPVLKSDKTGNASLRALCLTNNQYKVNEFKSVLTDGYGVRVFNKELLQKITLKNTGIVVDAGAIDDTANESIQQLLNESNPTPHFILLEETELRSAINHDPIILNNPINLAQLKSYHMMPVVNASTLHVWKPFWKVDGTLDHVQYKVYKHRINGYIDAKRQVEGGYGWDQFFVNSATGRTHAEDAAQNRKRSARQLTLDDHILEDLFYIMPKDLKNFPLSPKQAIDFDISVNQFVVTNPYLSNAKMSQWRLDHSLVNLLNRGLYFKASTSRPLKNYFSPPFGVPLTAKKSGPEETIFMMHDMYHHLFPDLIFDGNHSLAHKNVYGARRMMSEAMTMVLADMLYADSLVKSGIDPAFTDTRIYPLFKALDLPEITDENRLPIIIRLLKANTMYALMGDDSLWRAMLKPGQEDKLEAFKNHFGKFFIGDYAWTSANYHNMTQLDDQFLIWTNLIGRDRFNRAGITLLSDMVEHMKKRGCDVNQYKDVVNHIFDDMIEQSVVPVFKSSKRLSEDEQVSNAFYRYMIGQSSFYAKYRDLPDMLKRGEALIQRLHARQLFSDTERDAIREQFKEDVYYAWGQRVITTAQVANICQLHPIFPAVYISYARPLYQSIADAQKELYSSTVSQLAVEKMPLNQSSIKKINPYVRVINGVTFVDAIALEKSIEPGVPAKDRLRQKMINAGVEFWNEAKTTVKTPVIGISAIGGFSVSLEGDLPEGTIKLRIGNTQLGPLTPDALAEGLRITMGVQSYHTNMNPRAKTARELYDITTKLGHYSITHGAYLGFYLLGLSKKAELEFGCQRDLIHLSRQTSARSAAQSEPTVVALSEQGAVFSEVVMKNTATILASFKKMGDEKDWLEERNSFFSLSATVSLGINGSIRNLGKVVSQLNDSGKELEYRHALEQMNQSLHSLLPELFKPNQDNHHSYHKKPTHAKSALFPLLMASAVSAETAPGEKKPKHAILLLGAPGIGKSTQTERIAKRIPGVMCVSTGNLVRKLNKKIEDKQPLNDIEKKAAESLDLMKQGKLMDSKAVYALLMAHLSPGGEGFDEYQRCHTIILDGVIKAGDNIEPFENALNEFNGNQSVIPMSLNKVIHISASQSELASRHMARMTKAKTDGLPIRPDDDPEKYRGRIRDYFKNVDEVIKYYKDKPRIRYQEIDASHEADGTTQLLIEAVKADHPYLNQNKPGAFALASQSIMKAFCGSSIVQSDEQPVRYKNGK